MGKQFIMNDVVESEKEFMTISLERFFTMNESINKLKEQNEFFNNNYKDLVEAINRFFCSLKKNNVIFMSPDLKPIDTSVPENLFGILETSEIVQIYSDSANRNVIIKIK